MTEEKIDLVCGQLAAFLKEKNRRYGDSALKPINMFSKEGTALDKLLVRTDDKASRIINSKELRKNDIGDLIGYLILICIEKGWLNFDDLLD